MDIINAEGIIDRFWSYKLFIYWKQKKQYTRTKFSVKSQLIIYYEGLEGKIKFNKKHYKQFI